MTQYPTKEQRSQLTLDLPDQPKRLVAYFIKNFKQFFILTCCMVFQSII